MSHAPRPVSRRVVAVRSLPAGSRAHPGPTLAPLEPR